MAEATISFLYKAASSLPQSENHPEQSILKSYYLMRCREMAKDRGLPDKYFSSKVRCSRCFTAWKRGTDTKVRPIKLSKRQRKRIRHSKITKRNKEYVNQRKELLRSNEMVQVCSFCKHSEITTLVKPAKAKSNESNARENEANKEKVQIDVKKVNAPPKKQIPAKAVEVNVYSKAKDVYSLTNKSNTLPSIVKEQKVIKNNKKKKDKFAGLCQQAVLTSAKLKQEKDKQKQEKEKLNKLNLFLKPSS